MNVQVGNLAQRFKEVHGLLFDAMRRESVDVLNTVYGSEACHPFITGNFKLDREGRKVFEGSILEVEIVATCVI
jgi:hypothetical protein